MFLPGESQGRGSLVGYSLWGRKESDMAERLSPPQGTEVFPLLGSILHDPAVFEEPKEFNPGRFLDADGKFKKHEAFLPFSLGIFWGRPCPLTGPPVPGRESGWPSATSLFPPGKRVCLGEGLARTELFLLFTAILQAFSLEGPCPLGALSLQPAISGLFNIPQAFQLQFRPR